MHHIGLDDPPPARNVIRNFKPSGPIATQSQFTELLTGFGKNATRCSCRWIQAREAGGVVA